jgi:hypothetical protein
MQDDEWATACYNNTVTYTGPCSTRSSILPTHDDDDDDDDSSLDFPNASQCNQLISSSLLVFPLPPPSLRTSFRYLSYTQTIAAAYDCFLQICAQVFSCLLRLVLWIFVKPPVLVIFTKTLELVHIKTINKNHIWKSCFQFLQVVMCNRITMRLQRIFISKMKKKPLKLQLVVQVRVNVLTSLQAPQVLNFFEQINTYWGHRRMWET